MKIIAHKKNLIIWVRMAGAGQKPVRCAQEVRNAKQAAFTLGLQMEGRNDHPTCRSKECPFFFSSFIVISSFKQWKIFLNKQNLACAPKMCFQFYSILWQTHSMASLCAVHSLLKYSCDLCSSSVIRWNGQKDLEPYAHIDSSPPPW